MPQEANKETTLPLLPLGISRLPYDTPDPKTVWVPLVSVPSLSLVHLLMTALFLSPANA